MSIVTILAILLAILVLGDILTTLKFLNDPSLGLVEANPIINTLIDWAGGSNFLWVGIKVIVSGIAGWWLFSIGSMWGLIIADLMMAYVVYNNLKLIYWG